MRVTAKIAVERKRPSLVVLNYSAFGVKAVKNLDPNKLFVYRYIRTVIEEEHKSFLRSRTNLFL
jgi:hypothetical protein